jgi:hypothetical protein
MEKMVATSTHRIWAVTDLGEVVGLVALSAMIPLLDESH